MFRRVGSTCSVGLIRANLSHWMICVTVTTSVYAPEQVLSREITGKMYNKNYRNACKNLEQRKEVEINTSKHTHNQSRDINAEENTEDYFVLKNLPTASTTCGTKSES
jgi:hypothetical protein